MIGVSSFAATLSHAPPEVAALEQVEIIQTPAQSRKMLGPAAQYALETVKRLPELSEDTGLVCLTGFSGSTVAAFDRARDLSPDGRLVSADFPQRARKIHPFTLLRALQNQVPAALSLELGLRGPCTSAVDSAHWLPLITAVQNYLRRDRQVLLVCTAAANREEAASLHSGLFGNRPLEGCIALCLTSTPAKPLGYLTRERPKETLYYSQGEWPNFIPCLLGGQQFLSAFAAGQPTKLDPTPDHPLSKYYWSP